MCQTASAMSAGEWFGIIMDMSFLPKCKLDYAVGFNDLCMLREAQLTGFRNIAMACRNAFSPCS